MKVLFEDTISSGEGTTILRGHPSKGQANCSAKRVPSFLSSFTTKTKNNQLFKNTVFPVESFFFVYFFLTNDKNITPNPKPHIKIYFIIMKKPKESPIIQEFKKTQLIFNNTTSHYNLKTYQQMMNLNAKNLKGIWPP